jgi:hypothetical protein
MAVDTVDGPASDNELSGREVKRVFIATLAAGFVIVSDSRAKLYELLVRLNVDPVVANIEEHEV